MKQGFPFIRCIPHKNSNRKLNNWWWFKNIKLSQLVGPRQENNTIQLLIKSVNETDFIRVNLEAPKSDKVKNSQKFKCTYLDQEVTNFIPCWSFSYVLNDTSNLPKETKLSSWLKYLHVVFAKKLYLV